jgi:hypothetical protein
VAYRKGGRVMRILGRSFGRKGANGQSEAEREWSQRLRGIPVLQTADEQAAIRRGMEAELDAQRARRAQSTLPDLSV